MWFKIIIKFQAAYFSKIYFDAQFQDSEFSAVRVSTTSQNSLFRYEFKKFEV